MNKFRLFCYFKHQKCHERQFHGQTELVQRLQYDVTSAVTEMYHHISDKLVCVGHVTIPHAINAYARDLYV